MISLPGASIVGALCPAGSEVRWLILFPGNAAIGQSGGPTAVISQSLSGVIETVADEREQNAVDVVMLDHDGAAEAGGITEDVIGMR